MRILLIGYGKMGKSIEILAIKEGWTVAGTIQSSNDLNKIGSIENIDLAIDFTTPKSAFTNIKTCLEAGIITICGTTGWEAELEKAKGLVDSLKGTLFVASNFSIGMNIVFEANIKLAELTNRIGDYRIQLTEQHHIHKLDTPSGTAITLANQIIDKSDKLDGWELDNPSNSKLSISSIRDGETLGMHEVKFESDLDRFQLRHEAKSRDAFAVGVIEVAKWIKNRHGFLTMRDFLNL